jgi:hypothetical protein
LRMLSKSWLKNTLLLICWLWPRTNMHNSKSCCSIYTSSSFTSHKEICYNLHVTSTSHFQLDI